MWSREDELDGGAAAADVEFDVKTPENDVNIELEGKAVTIEPNEGEDAGAAPAEPAASEPAPAAEEPAAPAEPPAPAEGGDAGAAPAPETTEESLLYWV